MRMRKVSQGMLGMLARSGGAGLEQAERRAEVWQEVAPILEEMWAVGSEADAPPGGQQRGGGAMAPPPLDEPPRRRARASEAEAREVLELAEAAGVCSYAQTIEAARRFLLEDEAAKLVELVGLARGEWTRLEELGGVELDVVDEGHAAAVVRVVVAVPERQPVRMALLVARDLGEATVRLSAQASDLRVWHRMAPGRATAVLGEGSGRIRWFGQAREVAVVATRWIDGEPIRGRGQQDGSPLSGARTTPADPFLALGSGIQPALEEEGMSEASCELRTEQMTAVSGRRTETLLTSERRALRPPACMATRLAETRSALATFALDGACERTIDLAQGHAMVSRRGEIILVGSAARSWCGPLGAWPYRLAGATLGDALPCDEELMLAGDAMLAGLSILAKRCDGTALVTAMLQQACSPELARRALDVVNPDDRDRVMSVIQTLLPLAVPGRRAGY